MPDIRQISAIDSFLYREVFIVLEWGDEDCIKKTASTGMYIKYEDEHKLDKRRYVTTALSTSVTVNQKAISLPMFPLENK